MRDTCLVRTVRGALAAALLVWCPGPTSAQTPVGTAFSYQGRLTEAGGPASGTFDLQFIAYDAVSGGSQTGGIVTRDDVAVTAGLFTVQLDFGSLFASGNKRWLEVAVRPGASAGTYTVLSPRQELTPAPHATFAGQAGSAATIAGLSCSNGQVAKWSNGWTCGADVANTGTVTSVGTGAGLTGGPITGAGTIAVAANGITTGLIADAAITSVKIASGAVGSAQVNAAEVQARVTGSCPPGSTVQAVNPNGTVTCQPGNAQPGFSVSTIDSVGNVGLYTSIVIGTDGLGLISYADATNGDLKVAHCTNLACTSATVATLDVVGTLGNHTSIAVGVDGLGLVSYEDVGNQNLKVAHCSNTACDIANTVSTLDITGAVGDFSSLAIGTDGLGLISYLDDTNGRLKTAHCSNINCTSASLASIDTVTALEKSLTIGADGLGLISYYNGNTGQFKVLHCLDVPCTAGTAATLEGNLSGRHSSATVGSDGLGLIAYEGPNLADFKVAHCGDAACATPTLASLAPGVIARELALTIGADGLGVISYYDQGNQGNGDLKVAHCSNVPCTSATLASVDTVGDVGRYTSITIGVDGLPLISYYDMGNGDLKVAHCSNRTCTPFVRRR